MTDYAVDLLNVDSSEIEEQRIVHPTGATGAQPVVRNQVSPVGTVTSGALSTQQLVTATGAQVSTARDVDTYTPITASATNAVATCAVALSPDNVTYSTLYTISLAAAVNNTGAIALNAFVRVPAGWYVKMTTSNFTLGVTTYA